MFLVAPLGGWCRNTTTAGKEDFAFSLQIQIQYHMAQHMSQQIGNPIYLVMTIHNSNDECIVYGFIVCLLVLFYMLLIMYSCFEQVFNV